MIWKQRYFVIILIVAKCDVNRAVDDKTDVVGAFFFLEFLKYLGVVLRVFISDFEGISWFSCEFQKSG